MEQKKPTKGELEKRIANAVVFIPKDKGTISVYFDDKGMRLTATMDSAIVSTASHRHVFDMITASGNISRPYIYIKRIIEIANENDCIIKGHNGEEMRSYKKLLDTLKTKKDVTEYNILWYADLWFMNIFAPLYEIDETECGSWLVYERYLHNIARSAVLLEEHKEDVTAKQYLESVIELERSFMVDDLSKMVVINGKSDDERLKEEMDAVFKDSEEKNLNDVMEENSHGGEDS